MSTLVVMSFPDPLRAAELVESLTILEDEELIILEDAVVVVKDQQGRITLHQTHNLRKVGLFGGGGLGLAVGAILGLPLAGVGALALPLAGSLTGALGGMLTSRFVDVGIEDDFIRELSQQLKPGSSAVFVQVQQAQLDKVLPRLDTSGGRLLYTSLPPDIEARLDNAIKLLEARARLQAEQQQ